MHSDSDDKRPYSSGVLFGLFVGTIAGLLMAATAAVAFILAGGVRDSSGVEMNLLALSLVNVLGCMAGGLIAGLLQNLRHTVWGSGLMGSVAVAPWLTAVGLLYMKPMTDVDLAGLIVMCVLIGGGLGAYFGQRDTRTTT